MVIGIDLGGMSAKAALLDGNRLIGKARVVTNSGDGAEKTAEALARLAEETAKNAGIDFGRVDAIGIGSPGVIDSEKGEVVYWSNFHWEHVPLAALVEKYTHKKVFVTNDANAAALGEAAFGAGKRFRNSILVTLGTGVGGGIIIDGKLFEGYKSAGAEIGHMVIARDGELCTCGRRGCFERYASATALINRTREAMKKHPESLMWKTAREAEQADGRTAFDAMRAGDGAAKEVVAEYVAGLGEGIVNLVNLFRPEAILLGGGISAEKDALLVPLREYVNSFLYTSMDYAPLEILCAELGNDAGLYGAAQYALDRK